MKWITILVVLVMWGCSPVERGLDIPCNSDGDCNITGWVCNMSTNKCEADQCTDINCGDHGNCVDGTCVCIDGYTGEFCENPPADPCDPDPCADEHRVCVDDSGSAFCGDCLAGYHDEGGDCVEDTDCQPTTCSSHGTCDDLSGTPVCTCDLEYSGDHCETCADGYHWNADDTACTSDSCDPNPCDELHKGVCADDGGQAVCSCDNGYHLEGDDCVQDTDCQPTTCNSHGTCDDSSGNPVCTCDTGYAATACDQCDISYHPVGNDCVEDEVCLADSCSSHGACSTPSGVVECSCDTGYTGVTCSICDIGYQDNDSDGSCLPDCSSLDCGDHGSCDDSGGSTVCECTDGWSGANCEILPPITAEIVVGGVDYTPFKNGGNNAIHFRINASDDVEVSEYEFSFIFRDDLRQQISSIVVGDTVFYRFTWEMISHQAAIPEVDMVWDDGQCTSTFIAPESFLSGENQDYFMQINVSGVVTGDYPAIALTMVHLEDGRSIPIQGVENILPPAP